MADAAFEDPRLAALYDVFDGDRWDLDLYAGLVDEFGARTVLDVGCGTGSLACRLAERRVQVVALDPAQASLGVARGKPHAEKVRWLHGDAGSLPPLQVDLATMTGNVAQVFLTDEEWAATLRAVRAALRPLRVRDPAAGAAGVAGVDARAHVGPRRHPRRGRRRGVERGHRRPRHPGLVPGHLRLPGRRRGADVGLDAAVPQP